MTFALAFFQGGLLWFDWLAGVTCSGNRSIEVFDFAYQLNQLSQVGLEFVEHFCQMFEVGYVGDQIDLQCPYAARFIAARSQVNRTILPFI
jgi:hypothetical protein